MKYGSVMLFILMLLGCNQTPPPEEPPTGPAPAPPPAEENIEAPPAEEAAGAPAEESASDLLAEVLAAQPDEFQARYDWRHPRETLEFFGILPGMTVVEGLPGGGWYSQILVPYLGSEGRLIGANYPHEMWPLFGFFDQEFIDSMETWTTDWPQLAEEQWKGEHGASVEAFEFGSMPDEMEGRADAVLLVRVLHNLARFEEQGGFLTTALDEIYRVLKPGGIVGVVQHAARPGVPDDRADGSRGYLKKEFVIDRMTEAGFEFVDSSDVNENPADQPGEEDIVWRLPPSLMTSEDDPELRASMEEIGESHRMTLRFRKPE